MELLLLVLFAALTIASLLGWTADSRDFADWRPTNDGSRTSLRPRQP